MTVQAENAEMIDLLSGSFPRRNEPNFVLGNIASNHIFIPGLRATWPLTSMDESSRVIDISGQGRHLSLSGAMNFGMQALLSYAALTGANYLYRADEAGLDITGPLTVGGWFYFNNLAAQRDCITKWTAAGNQKAYALAARADGSVIFVISGDGASAVVGASPAGSVVATGWYFLAGRFIPNTEISVFVNLTKTTLAAGIPAAIFNSSAALLIGGLNGAATLAGRVSGAPWISAAPVEDVWINNLFEQEKGLFGYV